MRIITGEGGSSKMNPEKLFKKLFKDPLKRVL
jgi:hypothetical protein